MAIQFKVISCQQVSIDLLGTSYTSPEGKFRTISKQDLQCPVPTFLVTYETGLAEITTKLPSKVLAPKSTCNSRLAPI